jgi:hypothetical protein
MFSEKNSLQNMFKRQIGFFQLKINKKIFSLALQVFFIFPVKK